MGGSSAGSGNGGGGSPNQMAKDKAAKDKAVRDKEARQAKIREEQKNKRPTPKDDNKVIAPKPKPTVPKIKFTPKDDERDKQKVIVPKKKIDFKPVTKEVLNPNDNIQEKKKTPIITPKDDGGGAVKKPIVVKEVTKTAPTIAEVDQATTDTTPTETAETTEKNRLLKVKKRGRSSSIMTSAKGVTKTSSDYSLGRSSLLGRV
tara:strand:- start:68 stop:676 length:609 start_codon:yes stop_codon:yes gene_type:complete